MSNTKHTPGPWRAEPEHEGEQATFVHASARPIAVCDHGYSANEQEANARLIAAAPDMIEALQLLQEFDFRLDDSDHGKEIRRRVLAAIAKANG